jgi:hypothetical protein
MRYEDYGLREITNQLGDMAAAAVADQSIDKAELRAVLRFLSKVTQVVEQAFQDVLALMIEFKYVTDEDLQSGRVHELAKDLELLEARSHYRDAEEICSKLHHLEEIYVERIKPITQHLSEDAAWWAVLSLLDEHEGRIILLVHQSVAEMRWALTARDVRKINLVAKTHAEPLRESLQTLHTMNSQILGLSGEAGYLELVEVTESDDRVRTFNFRGEFNMGDRYEVSGQAGAVGPGSHAHDMSFTQIGKQIEESVDLPQLAEELSRLRQAMKAEATEAQHDIAVSEIAKAEQAAEAKDSSKVAEFLRSAGGWALDVASQIGVPLATAALRLAMGI